jgi:hypothetical protein
LLAYVFLVLQVAVAHLALQLEQKDNANQMPIALLSDLRYVVSPVYAFPVLQPLEDPLNQSLEAGDARQMQTALSSA